MAGFDVEGARKAGYSDAEIADHLAQENKFDVGGAKKSGYSDAEIIAHLTGAPGSVTPTDTPGGLTLADVGNAANSVVNTIGTGITKGVTGLLGMPKAGGEALLAGADYIGLPANSPLRQRVAGLTDILPSTEGMNKAIFSAPGSTGPLAMPEVNAADNPNLTVKPPLLGGGSVNLGKVVDASIQAVPSMFLAPAAVGGAIRQGITTLIPALTSGAAGEIAGQTAEGLNAPDWAQAGARILGSGAGYAVGNRAISPLPSKLTEEEARSVATAKAIPDMPLSVYQETGQLKNVESAASRSLGGGGQFEALRDKQALAAQGKALQDIGVTGGLNRTDPITMGEVFAQKNAEFNAAKNTTNPVTLDNQFYQDLAGHVQRYVDNTNPSTRIPSVAKRAQDFLDQAATATSENGPTVTGAQYQRLRSNVGEASYQATQNEAKQALKGIRTALDDAMVRSVSPDEAAAFQQARANWAGLKTISKAAVGGTVGSRSEGNLSPSALATALKGSQGPDVYARTTGGLNDIARMTAYLSDKVPNSGTAQSLNAMETIKRFAPGPATGAGAGGTAGFLLGGPLGALIGAPVGALSTVMGNNLLARALTGGQGMGWLRNYLVNQNAQNFNPALVGALVGGSQAAGQGKGR